MKYLAPVILMVLMGCQGAPLGEETVIPVTEIQNRSADVIAALKRGDQNADGKIEGASEQWAMINSLTMYLIQLGTELLNNEEE